MRQLDAEFTLYIAKLYGHEGVTSMSNFQYRELRKAFYAGASIVCMTTDMMKQDSWIWEECKQFAEEMKNAPYHT